AVLLHTGVTHSGEAKERAIPCLERVHMDSPRLRFDQYPDGLSGGMCQRAMIAMALASEPSLLIADEPTTGLDATIQSRIVALLAELKSGLGVTTLLITHDIRVVSRLADTIRARCISQEPALAAVTAGHRIRCYLYGDEPRDGARAG